METRIITTKQLNEYKLRPSLSHICRVGMTSDAHNIGQSVPIAHADIAQAVVWLPRKNANRRRPVAILVPNTGVKASELVELLRVVSINPEQTHVSTGELLSRRLIDFTKLGQQLILKKP